MPNGLFQLNVFSARNKTNTKKCFIRLETRVSGTFHTLSQQSLSLSNSLYVCEINSGDLCHFSISAHTTLQDYSRLTHIPHLHTLCFTLHWGGAPSLVLHGTVQLQGNSEFVWDDGVNKWDWLILQRWAAEMYLTEASKSQCSLQPIHTGRKGLKEAAGNVGTHTVFTIGKHTLRQNWHAQYHILFSYRAASVSWSSERLLNSTECRWRSCSGAESSSYSYCNGSSFPSGSQGKRGPFVPTASLQLL